MTVPARLVCPVCWLSQPVVEIARMSSDHMTGKPGPILLAFNSHRHDRTQCAGVGLVKAVNE